MKSITLRLALLLLAVSFALAPVARAQEAAKPLPLVDPAADGAAQRFIPTSNQVTVAPSEDPAAPGLIITIAAGDEGYPGARLTPPGDKWDLSAFGHVEAKLTNTGKSGFTVALRVDNAGDWQKNPWNTEQIFLKPGATTTQRVIFGHAYGHKPGYKLNPAEVIGILIFTGKAKEEQSMRLEYLVAGGETGEKPQVAPKDVRIKPPGGVLLGATTKIDAEKQLGTKGATASVVSQDQQSALRLEFPVAKAAGSVTFKPAVGRWDLRDSLEVRVKLTNAGKAAVTPRLRIESNGGPSDTIVAPKSLEPGQQQEIVIPVISTSVATGQRDTGTRVTTDSVSGVTIIADPSDEPQLLTVNAIVAGMPPTPALPAWLGKRPPVEGDWVMTFDEEFNGPEIDKTRWGIYTTNYWDKRSHFSKDNVILGDGVVRLRMEKKRGHDNDDPTAKETDYAVGFLDTYGKWVQRYGYFEARVKPPTAPGLWPAFWMMPDRGEAVGPQWKRADTKFGGMEFDIYEHLTRWGPNRYNVAMHWDGYQKEHKGLGSDKIYSQPDKDGFLTCGMLWTPGLLVYYAQGKEVLRWENERVGSVPANLILYMVTGGWDNNSLDDAQLPADFVVDYVRCWQRRDLSSEVDTTKP